MGREKRTDVIWTSREVALTLDMSPDTVNELARRNMLPGFKKGRQWRFKKRDVFSFKREWDARRLMEGPEAQQFAAA